MLHGFANAQNYYSKMYDLFGGWEAAYQVIVYDSSTILFWEITRIDLILLLIHQLAML